jgi:hypothetical protein
MVSSGAPRFEAFYSVSSITSINLYYQVLTTTTLDSPHPVSQVVRQQMLEILAHAGRDHDIEEGRREPGLTGAPTEGHCT